MRHVPSRREERSSCGGDLEDRRLLGGGGIVARGQDVGTQGPWFPGTGVKDIWEDRVLGAWGLCRETHGVEVVGVLAAHCILTPDL